MLDRVEELIDYGDYWSLSKLQTIEECGAKFKFRYVIKAPEKKRADLRFGSAVHKCLELMHKESIWEDGQVQRLWADQWTPVVSQIDWENEVASKTVYKNRGLKMLEKYKESHKDDHVLLLEQRFKITGDTRLGGVIDKITTRNGYPAVVDYKTSKYPPDPLVLRADPQLTMYYIAAKEIGYETDQLAIHNLFDGEEYWTTRNDSDVEMLWEMIRQAQEKVKHQMYGRNVGFNCKFCGFKEQCLGGIGNDSSSPVAILPTPSGD